MSARKPAPKRKKARSRAGSQGAGEKEGVSAARPELTDAELDEILGDLPKTPCERAVMRSLLRSALEGDVAAQKFFLNNYFPDRWSLNAHPTKPPLGRVAVDPDEEDDDDDDDEDDGLPYRMQLVG